MFDNSGSSPAAVSLGRRSRKTVQVPDIPPSIVEQIRAQNRTAAPGMESVGRIVMSGGHALRYEPLANHAGRRDQFQIADGELTGGLARGETPILVHTHPNRGDKLHPSHDDLHGANASWLGVPYAIYLARLNALALFALNGNRRGYTTLGLVR